MPRRTFGGVIDGLIELASNTTFSLGVGLSAFSAILYYCAPAEFASHWWQPLSVGVFSACVSVCRPFDRWLATLKAKKEDQVRPAGGPPRA